MKFKKLFCCLLILSIICCFSGCFEANHNDGKCDVCGKKAASKGSNWELCLSCMLDANDWYYKDNENYGGFK